MPRTVEVVVYKGIKYRRYPESEDWSKRSYFVSCHGSTKAGVGRLHQEIRKDAHGPIPEGHEIHHRDGDPSNNVLDNLECITHQEHMARHAATRSPEELERLRAVVDRIRPLAAEWHRSEEGRAWHREHGAATWVDRPMVDYTCERCGVPYQSRSMAGQNRFCSNNCRSAARRASGADHVTSACRRCGGEFRHDRFKPRAFCSRLCSNRARSDAARAGLQPDG